ncbi:hypothetical protein J2W27_003997 [Variovorax boronicumulans]|uniref:hypothetical protein n=1 Tax=Variovorax boronicumulans TaxID=436515 RepID=UPI0027872DE4|nr:hypothetical protein [Variovorax boronicumulans]MDP9911873.1 hypothetical protein [Variovorax boronicumulans]
MHQPDLLDCALPADSGSIGSLAASVESVREVRSGRPAIHADNASKVRAHRAGKARIDFTDDPKIKQTIVEISRELGCSEADVLRSITRFALTNRNWKQVGLYGSKGLQ